MSAFWHDEVYSRVKVTAPLVTGVPRDLVQTARFANEFAGHGRDSRPVTPVTHGRPSIGAP